MKLQVRFSATAPVSEVSKTPTYTRAYARSTGFLSVRGEINAALGRPQPQTGALRLEGAR